MNHSEIIDKLLNGEMKLYQVDKEVSAKEATDIRREFLEKKYSINLDNLSNYTLDMERASARNIENSIGVLQLPMVSICCMFRYVLSILSEKNENFKKLFKDRFYW